MPASAPTIHRSDPVNNRISPEAYASCSKPHKPEYETTIDMHATMIEAPQEARVNTRCHDTLCSQYQTESTMPSITFASRPRCHQEMNEYNECRHLTNASSSHLDLSNNQSQDSLLYNPRIHPRLDNFAWFTASVNRCSFDFLLDKMNNQSPGLVRKLPTYFDSPTNSPNVKRVRLMNQTDSSHSSTYTSPEIDYASSPGLTGNNNDSMDLLAFGSTTIGTEWSNQKTLPGQKMMHQEEMYNIAPLSSGYFNNDSKHTSGEASNMYAQSNINRGIDFNSIAYLDNPTDADTSDFLNSPTTYTGYGTSSPFSHDGTHQSGFLDDQIYFPTNAASDYQHDMYDQPPSSAYNASSINQAYLPFVSSDRSSFDFSTSASDKHPTAAFTFTPSGLSSVQMDGSGTDQPSTSNSRSRVMDREAMDRKLVHLKNQGMTYKEIKKQEGWGLEESTLRGRYRTLTKPKHQRVRKPGWNRDSVRPCSAVQYLR